MAADARWALLALGVAWWRCSLAEDVICPPGWTRVGSHCFWLSEAEHTFESCQLDVCGPKGGTLACIRSDEHAWLSRKTGLVNSTDLLAAWIGLSDAYDHKTWSWINGCNSNWTYWLRGEPDNYCGGEDCAAITGAGGRWMDASCRLRLPCLCEYGGSATEEFNLSITDLRDDTCYADCGALTRWCTAWPFLRLYDANDDLCHWEEKDGQKRGRGASECSDRVAANPKCSKIFSYSVGHCRCSPSEGRHSQCRHRVADITADIFEVDEDGAELIHPGQRCMYGINVDEAYFDDLKPATSWGDWAQIWLRAAAIWLAVGVPCAAVMICVMSRSLCSCRGEEQQARGSKIQGGGGRSYGPLIEAQNQSGYEGAADEVNRWVFRAATGAIVYGFALLGLGVTLAAHMAGHMSNFYMELLESLAMTISMAAVGRAGIMVHRHLSSVAKDVVGIWVLVFSLGSLGLSVAAFSCVIVFSTLADHDYEMICFAEYLFRWSLLMVLPFQCLTGSALSRVQARAERYAGSEARVGGWATLLVFGNFSCGCAVWWAGYLDCVHEAQRAVAFCFVLAAGGQLISGGSLLMLNWKVKQYFTEGGQELEMQADKIGAPEQSPSATDD